MKKILPLLALALLTGCASIQSGIHNAATAIANIAPDIAQGAKTVTTDVGAAGIAVVDTVTGVGSGAQAISTATAPAVSTSTSK